MGGAFLLLSVVCRSVGGILMEGCANWCGGVVGKICGVVHVDEDVEDRGWDGRPINARQGRVQMVRAR